MTTIAICMVKVMRLQKPSPNDVATATGDAPLSRAAAATTATARATKTYASGNQRSAQFVNRSPRRARTPSPRSSPGVGWDRTEAAVGSLTVVMPIAPRPVEPSSSQHGAPLLLDRARFGLRQRRRRREFVDPGERPAG